jgi:hypothetical protein
VHLTQMKCLKMLFTKRNMMIHEFQDHKNYQYVMMMKNSELIDDHRYQQEMRDQPQIFHDLPQSRYHANWFRPVLNHPWIEYFVELSLI